MVKFRFILLIMCSVVFIMGCEKENIETQLDESLVVRGQLIVGENIGNIELVSLNPLGGEFLPIIDAEVNVIEGNKSFRLTHDDSNPGWYSYLGTYFVEPETTYELLIRYKGNEITSNTLTPPQSGIEVISTQELMLSDFAVDQPFFTVQWTAFDGYSSLLRLEVLDDDPDLILFEDGVQGGQFDQFYHFPIPNEITSFFPTDFRYYGTHFVQIYAISEEYRSLFFYSPELTGGNLEAAPSNVIGGYGYFVAVSRISFSMNLNP